MTPRVEKEFLTILINNVGRRIRKQLNSDLNFQKQIISESNRS